MKKIIFICFCLLSSNALALEAHLFPNPIMKGESTELTISSDQPVGLPSNLKELTQNFMIAGQQQRQSSQFVNGVGSTTYELALVLFPLIDGDIQIPALQVGAEKTAPLTLKIVDEKKNSKTDELAVLKLSASVSDESPYIGQTIFYSLTLTDGQGILDGEIVPSKIDGAHLSQIGQDKVNSVIKDGNRVQEIQRTYTLIPSKEGKLEIPPALFNGKVNFKSSRPTNKHKFFGIADAETLFGNFFTSVRPVSFYSNPIVIEVQPKPEGIKGWWLPSSKVELTTDYQIPDIVQVGDTLTGKFILSAENVNANDMPVPHLRDSTDFRIYPQPEERTTSIIDGHLMGKVVVPFTLIPLKVGNVKIPEVSVGWFNTVTKKSEKASVAPQILTVEQGKISPIIDPSYQESEQQTVQEQEVKDTADSSFSWLFYVLGSVIIILTIIIIILFKYHHKTGPRKKKEKPLPDFYPF